LNLDGGFDPKASAIYLRCPTANIDWQWTLTESSGKIGFVFSGPQVNSLQVRTPEEIAYSLIQEFVSFSFVS